MAIRCGRVRSCALSGIHGIMVDIEAALLPGLPSFDIVGLGDSAVCESRNRVHAAIKNSGFQFPSSRITVSLAPAWLRKEGSGFDLPLALAILIASGQLSQPESTFCAFGELGLTGEIRSVPGAICRAASCLENGFSLIAVPWENASEARSAGPATYLPVRSLREITDILQDGILPEPFLPEKGCRPDTGALRSTPAAHALASVIGQKKAVRAIKLAAAGRHNILLLGSPGCGKTTLASALPGILPPLERSEALQVTRIFSASGLLAQGEGLIERRPFRAPHHSISRSAMVGGGSIPVPGEISLAHQGVLFLDEMTEFRPDVLDLLRQPLEEQQVRLVRLRHSMTYPADFVLVGAANPCRCGDYYEPDDACRCSPDLVRRHLGRLSGPLLDRMDLVVEMTRLPGDILPLCVAPQKNASAKKPDDAEQVGRCWSVQLQRMKRQNQASPGNGRQHGDNLSKQLEIDNDIINQAAKAASGLGLSVRGYQRLLRVSRTIADLDGDQHVRYDHVAEALQYRMRWP